MRYHLMLSPTGQETRSVSLEQFYKDKLNNDAAPHLAQHGIQTGESYGNGMMVEIHGTPEAIARCSLALRQQVGMITGPSEDQSLQTLPLEAPRAAA